MSSWGSKFVTDPSHYPPEHQAYLEEDIIKLKRWSESIGPEAAGLVSELLGDKYPLRHLKRCQAILALSRTYSASRLERAVANRFNNKNLQYIERVIKAIGQLANLTEQKGGVRSSAVLIRICAASTKSSTNNQKEKEK
jgi:hypothetical protein